MKTLNPLKTRLSLSNLNTPVEKCDRITALFPEGPEIFIKRDDFIGSLVWGNKLRKLEFSFADAVNMGADTIITCGGVQSNHSRITAQLSKRLGLDCVLVQNGEPEEFPTGNHKINRLLDIPIHYVKTPGEREPRMQELADKLGAQGYKPYVIPLGASNGIGCLGFVEAVKELKEQQESMGISFDKIVHSSSSGGTQAGLELGKRIYDLEKLEVIGISSDTSIEGLKNSILSCTGPAITNMGAKFTITREELHVDDSYIGPGYGLASPESLEAKELFIRYEGIFLDTTYTAKAAAGLIDYIRKGKFVKGQKVLFWHTGGILAEI